MAPLADAVITDSIIGLDLGVLGTRLLSSRSGSRSSGSWDISDAPSWTVVPSSFQTSAFA